jgi:hypothetical protein
VKRKKRRPKRRQISLLRRNLYLRRSPSNLSVKSKEANGGVSRSSVFFDEKEQVIMLKRFNSFEPALKAAEETGVFYVVNSSDKEGKQNQGKLILSVKTEDGSSTTITIQPTWIPYNLLDYAPLDAIKKSSEIRNYHRTGLISLITVDTAEILKSKPNYQKELHRYSHNPLAIPVTEEISTFEMKTVSSTSSRKEEEVSVAKVTSGSSNADPLIKKHYDFYSNKTTFQDLHDLIETSIPQMDRSDWEKITSEINDRKSFLFQVASHAIGNIDVGEEVKLDNFPFYEEFMEDMTE